MCMPVLLARCLTSATRSSPARTGSTQLGRLLVEESVVAGAAPRGSPGRAAPRRRGGRTRRRARFAWSGRRGRARRDRRPCCSAPSVASRVCVRVGRRTTRGRWRRSSATAPMRAGSSRSARARRPRGGGRGRPRARRRHGRRRGRTRLSLPLDALAVRKIGYPWQPEYGIGAARPARAASTSARTKGSTRPSCARRRRGRRRGRRARPRLHASTPRLDLHGQDGGARR